MDYDYYLYDEEIGARWDKTRANAIEFWIGGKWVKDPDKAAGFSERCWPVGGLEAMNAELKAQGIFSPAT